MSDEITQRDAHMMLGFPHPRALHDLVRAGIVVAPKRAKRGNGIIWSRQALLAACVSFDYREGQAARRVWITASTASLTCEPTPEHPDYAPKIRGWDVERLTWGIYTTDRIERWHHGTI